MNECKVTFHPVFVEAVKDAAELDEERTRLQAVMGADTFERVRAIIEAQPARKRAAFYGTIYEATCAGLFFARVYSLEEIADLYAGFIMGRGFYTYSKSGGRNARRFCCM